ncbi:MAG: dihydrofolate reductase [Caldilinea sp. CFX5]|nr:dihydrofolate reductase [Caldilinea sp. CFX5]
MRKLTVFNHVSLDGYFVDSKGDMSWAHADPQDAEWNAFVTGNAGGGGTLVLGRVTYDLMVSFWPTPMAAQMMPAVAERMNNLPKVLFSRTLDKATWNNTTLLKGDIAAETRKLKETPGPDMTILGSGTIVAQLAQAGLIDEYQFVVNPIVLGQGRTMFEGLPEKVALQLTQSRTFGKGNVFLSYQPVGREG